MFIVDYIKAQFNDFMSWFGLLPENSKILFLGLDNQGKTTLLNMLKNERMQTHDPTMHPHSEELYIGSRRFQQWDLGGHLTQRRIWRDYYQDVDAIIFLVDAQDRTRMEEAKIELQFLFENEALRMVPFQVLGNKIDIPTQCNDDELMNLLELPNPNYGQGYGYGQNGTQLEKNNGSVQCQYRPGGGPVQVFMVSLLQKHGYHAQFKWVVDVLKNKPKQ